MFRIFKKGVDGGEGSFYENEFFTKKSARHFCKNLTGRASSKLELVIVYPDGTEEKFAGHS